MASVSQYLNRVAEKLKGGNATEHSYRSALEFLFESAAEDVSALNEPKRVACGAPDFIISQKSIAVGHCEAKDLIVDLSDLKGANVDQKQRYLKALPNLCYTNSLDFEFYRNGSLIRTVSVGERVGNAIKPSPKNFADLSAQLADFVAQRPQTITSSRSLAILMAGKATLIKDILFKAMVDDKDGESELNAQYRAFKTHLIEDIQPEEFADIYAETISYGMFAARLHDTSLATFSRQEALELLPKSNPFLRSLFGYIAGADLDDRIRWVLDDLADVFQACDVHSLMHDFGTLTQQNDPFLHFYETFLAAYNPKKRRARGVWYTPEPIVNFIVRAVDDRLIEDFGLPMGLADSSKVAIKWDHGQKGKLKKEVHRVQILDPATGTGTFLAETIKQISARVKGIAPGLWSKYIEDDLIPRLHGFELLMASYAMCHMKLDMVLTELGYVPTKQNPRLGVYLTNSLEEGHIVSQDLFAQWFTNEAKLASAIKRDMPIMCVIGNPPYSKASTNKGTYISSLVADYKKGLGETSLNSLSDDYVKFIRYAEHHIERAGQGIVAMITNNSFLDGVVHRQMRKRLMSTFDDIYIYNLHGDSNKKEVSPDGGVDKNVFDIRQGVSVAIMVRKEQRTKQPAKVHYLSSYGSRSTKYRDLWDGQVANMKFSVLKPDSPYFFFKDKDLTNREVYEKGFKLSDLFIEYGSGIKFRKDNLLIRPHFDKESVRRMVLHMQKSTEAKILEIYGFNETGDWTIEEQRANFEDFQEGDVRRVLYRPFDFRFTYYPLHRISAIIPRGDSRKGLMHNMNSGKNLALLVGRQNKSGAVDHFLVTDAMSEMKTGERTIQSYHMPLYIDPAPGALVTERRSNLNTKIATRIRKLADPKGLKPPSDVDLFDYIYGILYSPSYRQTYSEFLKIDFPHIPYPISTEGFWKVVGHGSMLRRLHLMEEKAIGATNTPFVGAGDGMVATPTFEPSKPGWGKIMINSTQGFENVAETTWKIQIGGYQPADRWLKEREGLTLSLVDIMQYQKVLKILAETNRLVAEMDADQDLVR